MMFFTKLRYVTISLIFGTGIFYGAGCSDINSLEQSRDSSTDILAPSKANAAATHAYEVTIENLTKGQPFSPGIIVTHTKQTRVWEAGSSASDFIINLAEDGLAPDNLPDGVTPDGLIEELRQQAGVFQVVATGVPIDDNTASILEDAPDPSSSATFTIEAAANANRLSVAVMIICTNDGFTGLSSVKLPGGFKPAVFETTAYDAGSEPNTEQYADIVDPCQVIGPDTGPPPIPNGNDTPEGDVGTIQPHGGIQGIATEEGLDPALHNWDDPVARITVRRIK